MAAGDREIETLLFSPGKYMGGDKDEGIPTPGNNVEGDQDAWALAKF